MKTLKSVLGLFLPIPCYKTGVDKKGNLTNEKIEWTFTLQIGIIPLGWIIILVALIIKHLPI